MYKSILITLNSSIKNINRIEPLFSSILAKNLSTSTAATNSNPDQTSNNKALKVRLFASVCVERLPIITCDMNELEQKYSNLINNINIRKSYLSNHEIRHFKDIERANKKKNAKENNQEEEDIVIETAIDFEDRCLKELKSIQFGERKIAASKENHINNNTFTDQNTISYLKNSDYVLDKKLILLVLNKETFNWQLPAMEWSNEHPSLRATAEQTIQNLNKDLNVKFLGNAPVGIYKEKTADKFYLKHYFFKAQYKSGAEIMANSKLDFVWIRKDELKYFIKNKDYLDTVLNFVLDF